MTTRTLDLVDLEDLARGAAILGTGGGGDPHLGMLIASEAITAHGPVTIVDTAEIDPEAMVVSVGMIGAPTVIVEKVPSGTEAGSVFSALSSTIKHKISAVGCLEAGGLNLLTPISVAAMTGLPLVDGDGMGRAFPELHMVMATVAGVPATPMAIADERGNTSVINTVSNEWAERLARSAAVEMGCSAWLALYSMRGKQLADAMVPGTLTLAQRLGAEVRYARKEHRDPVQAVLDQLSGFRLFTGKIVDVDRRTEGGFARGVAKLVGLDGDDGKQLRIDFQNELLLATCDGQTLCSVPDLICALETDNGQPVTTESLRYGMRVTIVAAPCDPRWRSPAGLDLVGPAVFGFSLEYTPIEVLARRRAAQERTVA